jgi:peptidoglycan hydrolase CwlO-like protein
MNKKVGVKRLIDVASGIPKRVNLSNSAKRIAIPLRLLGKLGAFSVAIAVFFGWLPNAYQSLLVFGEVQANVSSTDSGGGITQDQRTQLESQLAELEKQINDNQKTIDSYKKQGSSLKNEINVLNTKISKLNLQIKAVNLNLDKLNQNITEAQRQINQTENKIDTHKDAISKSLQALYEADGQSVVEVLLANNHLSDFFGNLANVTLVQNNLRVALAEMVKLRQDLITEKEDLTTQKEDTENLKAVQQSQKATVQSTQTEKTNLLKDTQGKEAEYQKILQKTKETAAQIRSRIFELLGGGELTFEKAYDYAKLAEGATGVRAAMILAILNRESLLGKNTGRCSYHTAMNPKDIPTFLSIARGVGIDSESTIAYVSCPNSDGRYGGAMGPAQFIPSTWKLYSD